MLRMDVLSKVKKRFTKNGYNVKAYEKDFGWRLVGEQEGGWLSSDKKVLIYLVAKVAAESKVFLGFIDDLEHFHREFSDNYDIKGGYFIVSGKYDEKELRSLKRRANEDVRDLIRIESVKGEEPRPVRKEEEGVGEEHEHRIEEKPSELQKILQELREYRPLKPYTKEDQLQNSLMSWLSRTHRIREQSAYENTKIDAVIGRIGIEIKLGPDEPEYDRLLGQIQKYLKHLDYVIAVVGRERSKESTEGFKDRLREMGWLDKRVFLVRV